MPFEPVTRAYAEARRKAAYGNSIYRCTCGFEGWGRATTLHSLRCKGLMANLDTLVIDPKPPKQYKPKA